MLDRAKEVGFTSLALTADFSWVGNRERETKTGFTVPPSYSMRQCIDALKSPAWSYDFMSRVPYGYKAVPDADFPAESLVDFIAAQVHLPRNSPGEREHLPDSLTHLPDELTNPNRNPNPNPNLNPNLNPNPNPNPNPDPNQVPFGDFDQFLFSTGDEAKWLVASKNAVLGDPTACVVQNPPNNFDRSIAAVGRRLTAAAGAMECHTGYANEARGT